MLDTVEEAKEELEAEKESDFDAIDRTIKSTESYNRYAESDQYEKKDEQMKKDREKRGMQNQFNYYFVVYFDTDKMKNEFCKEHNLDYDYVYHEDLKKILGKEVKK